MLQKINTFINEIRGCVANHSCYMWGGQGELVKDTKISTIIKNETSPANARRVLNHVTAFYEAGYSMTKARFFDCSGLMTYHLIKEGVIDSDTTADGLKKKCVKISFKNAQPGDFCFKLDKSTGKANHVAAISRIDSEGNAWIIEAKGRDDGVIERKYNKSFGFTYFGRPKFWT